MLNEKVKLSVYSCCCLEGKFIKIRQGVFYMKNIRLQKNVPCTVRDGTTLYADIYRPDQEGKFPVLLTRLPYSKDDPFYSHRYLDTNRLVQNGYIVMIQDVRGRFQSEGDFHPFIYEAEDGYDTVEWAAKLPYSTGEIGMFGLSYYGYTQLLAAKTNPPHLKAIFPAMTLNDLQTNMVEQNCVSRFASFKTWIIESILPDLIKRKYTDIQTYQVKMRQWASALNNLESSFHKPPLNEWPIMDELGVGHYLKELLSLPDNDETWEKTRITDHYQDFHTPAFHLGGWYDNLLQSTLENFQQMHKQTNQLQKIMIGPWTHGNFSGITGERQFGMQASEHFLDLKEDLTNLHIRWFDYWLKGVPNEINKEPPIQLFVMGINKWRYENEWPLARASYVPYYFHSHGHANSCFGDGVLSTTMPEDEPVDTFIHNPNSPIPTNGGQTLFYGINHSGCKNQRWLEEREDMLVFTTAPLKEAIEVTGPIKVKLWALSDTKATDFTAKLVDVYPDQTAYNLTDGIVRVNIPSSKNGDQEVDCYEIDLLATSNVFLPGHSIRVEIASSNHPQFDVNPNTGKTLLESKQTKKAKQTIYHCRKYPSHIILPIV